MFTDIPILLNFQFSSTKMLAFLICIQLVIVSHHKFPLTFFAQMMISDDAAELLLVTKWVSVVVRAYGLGKFFESLIGVELMSSACMAGQQLACLIICRGTGDAVENMYILL